MPRDYSKIKDPKAREEAKKKDRASSNRSQAKMDIKYDFPTGTKRKAAGKRGTTGTNNKSRTGRYTGGGF